MSKRVLIADDGQLFRQMLKDILARAGFDVVGEAKNGIEAIRLAASLKPDIVVLDIVMPEQNGLEAAKCIRELGFPVKIVMCSSLGHDTVVSEAVDITGANAFIIKPIEEQAVLNVMRGML